MVPSSRKAVDYLLLPSFEPGNSCCLMGKSSLNFTLGGAPLILAARVYLKPGRELACVAVALC